MQLLEVSASEISFYHSKWNFDSYSFLDNSTELKNDFLIGCKINGESKIVAFGRSGFYFPNLGKSTKIQILILDSDLSEIEAFGNFLRFSFASPKVPLEAEWVKILKVYKEYFKLDLAKDGIPPHLMQILKQCQLEPHLGVLTNRARFQFLTFEELNFLTNKKWDPACFELFEAMPSELRAALFTIAKHESMTAQLMKEISNNALTISKKLSLKAALTLLQSPKQILDDIRVSLFRTAQPELYSMSEERIQKLRALKAPPRTIVFGDPSFETDGIRITHTPRNIQDFERFKNWIENEEIADQFKSIFEFYHQ